MMVEFQVFLLFLGAALLMAITPGPGMFYVAAGMFAGGPSAWSGIGLGTVVGGLCMLLPGAVGIFALVKASAEAFTLLKRAGAVYPIWLGPRHGPKPRSSIRSGWR